ncbi:MAG: GNAT family N-acetyltransferase [Spirochaetes bacterium]|nr:GNAT family N-acetyltransferase [Spirochaetota bacterium]
MIAVEFENQSTHLIAQKYKKKEPSMIDVTIRRAMLSDIPDLVEHRLKFLLEYQPESLPAEDYQQYLIEYYKDKLSSSQFVAFLAYAENQCVSSAGLLVESYPPKMNQKNRIQGTVFCVYTFPEWRRKGISKKVLERLIDYSRVMHIEKLKLYATKMGEPLYRMLGFLEPEDLAMELKIDGAN